MQRILVCAGLDVDGIKAQKCLDYAAGPGAYFLENLPNSQLNR